MDWKVTVNLHSVWLGLWYLC